MKVKQYQRPSDLAVSWYSLRVSTAQVLLIQGYYQAAIMRAGGWSNTETVSRYLRFSQHNIWMLITHFRILSSSGGSGSSRNTFQTMRDLGNRTTKMVRKINLK